MMPLCNRTNIDLKYIMEICLRIYIRNLVGGNDKCRDPK